MEMGEAVAPASRASPGLRYKVITPWRLQAGFVRRQANNAAASAPGGAKGRLLTDGKSVLGRGDCQSKRCTRNASAKGSGAENGGAGIGPDSGLGNSGINGSAELFGSKMCTKDSAAGKMENGGQRGAGDDGDFSNYDSNGVAEDSVSEGSGQGRGGGVGTAAGHHHSFGGSNGNGTVHGFGSGGSAVAGHGKARDSEGMGSNAGVKKCITNGSGNSSMNECVSKSSGSSAADCTLKRPDGNGGSTGGGAAKESDVGTGFCSMASPGSNGNDTNCRRGRKVLAPWRFQVGQKRPFSEAFSSSGSLGTPEYRGQGSSTQCSPATRSTVKCYSSAHSSVRVSAMRDFSSLKSENETSSAYKKRKTDRGYHSQVMPNGRVALARESVRGYLRDFRLLYRELLGEEEHKSRDAPDLQAYKIFRDRFMTEFDDKKYVGNVPGIDVGDVFHMRVELCVVGLHRPHRLGVDHIKEEDGTCVAVSIVSYAQSSDVKNNFDLFVYAGSRAATVNQKIDGTNLALKKSMDTNTPVRAIHGFITYLGGNCQKKKITTYVYGGLYLVEKYWRENESKDCYVYMFRLRRMEGQKHIDMEEILKSRKAESYDGIIMTDISQGLERIPISVVNTILDELPMPYRYMSRLQYPRNYQSAPPAGCGCVGGCSDSKNCACAVKNGGEIPFNDKGLIVEAKPLVYECGPSCMCPPTCHNRVGQKGMKFRLQIFKTKSMGWGVRTLDFIPSGSFVCEYIGEVLHDAEAQERTTDEYLFGIGHNYYDETLWEGLSRSIPSLQKGPGKKEDAGFAVDASKMGNFAKFINHSCSPNLYAQNVLYDHDDINMPHVMFFASENIPPHQELAYHYNYPIDQVHDANGNIKKKKCLCGSIECDGWLY